MGCCPCFGNKDEDLLTPDPEIRRRQQAEAAEQRLKALESRGIKDPESVKRMKQKDLERERLEKTTAGYGSAELKWQVS